MPARPVHHDFVEQLRELEGANVVEGVRMVRDGNVVSAGGDISGIEMSLWLMDKLWGEDAANWTKSYIAYDNPPREVVVDTVFSN